MQNRGKGQTNNQKKDGDDDEDDDDRRGLDEEDSSGGENGLYRPVAKNNQKRDSLKRRRLSEYEE